jgi:hypothetical protein
MPRLFSLGPAAAGQAVPRGRVVGAEADRVAVGLEALDVVGAADQDEGHGRCSSLVGSGRTD